MMSTHIQQAGLLSGRSMTLMAVIGLHALVIAALIAIRTVPALIDPGPGPVIVVLDRPPELVPPEPLPSLPTAPAAVSIPTMPVPVPVLIPIDTAEAIPAPVGVAVQQQESTVQIGPVVPVAPVATVPVRASTELQYKVTRSTDEYYPDASVALEEQGVAIVQVCVDAAGRIQVMPTIQESSGYKRLDKAALRWASEALRFTPATRDGVAVASCKGFRVKFNLR